MSSKPKDMKAPNKDTKLITSVNQNLWFQDYAT